MHQESLFKLRHRETAEDRKQRALYYRTIKSFYPPALQVAFRDLLFNFGSCWCIIKGGWRRISHTHCLLLGANLTPAYPEHKAADWAGSIPVCTNRPFLPTELSATLSYFFTKNMFWCNELVTFDIFAKAFTVNVLQASIPIILTCSDESVIKGLIISHPPSTALFSQQECITPFQRSCARTRNLVMKTLLYPLMKRRSSTATNGGGRTPQGTLNVKSLCLQS